jgi:hypothetical protein
MAKWGNQICLSKWVILVLHLAEALRLATPSVVELQPVQCGPALLVHLVRPRK